MYPEYDDNILIHHKLKPRRRKKRTSKYKQLQHEIYVATQRPNAMSIKNANIKSNTEMCLNYIQFPQTEIDMDLTDQSKRFLTSNSMKYTIYNKSFIPLLILGYFRRFDANSTDVSQIVAQYILPKKIEDADIKFKYKGYKHSLFTIFYPFIFWRQNKLNGIYMPAATEKSKRDNHYTRIC